MFLWNLNARAVGLSRDLRHSRQVALTVNISVKIMETKEVFSL